jgi:hypothetical protein
MSARAIKLAAIAISALVVVVVTLALWLPGADPRPPQLGDPVDVICPAPPGTPDAGPAMRIPVQAQANSARCLGAGQLAQASKAMTTEANEEES